MVFADGVQTYYLEIYPIFEIRCAFDTIVCYVPRPLELCVGLSPNIIQLLGRVIPQVRSLGKSSRCTYPTG